MTKQELSERRKIAVGFSILPGALIAKGIGAAISWAHSIAGQAVELVGLVTVSFGIAYIITGIIVSAVEEW
jgi:hypothetical protein